MRSIRVSLRPRFWHEMLVCVYVSGAVVSQYDRVLDESVDLTYCELNMCKSSIRIPEEFDPPALQRFMHRDV